MIGLFQLTDGWSDQKKSSSPKSLICIPKLKETFCHGMSTWRWENVEQYLSRPTGEIPAWIWAAILSVPRFLFWQPRPNSCFLLPLGSPLLYPSKQCRFNKRPENKSLPLPLNSGPVGQHLAQNIATISLNFQGKKLFQIQAAQSKWFSKMLNRYYKYNFNSYLMFFLCSVLLFF